MPTKIVYANDPYIYAYAWHNTDQKAAKIPGGTPLEVLGLAEGGWYEITPLAATGGTYQPATRWFVDPALTYEAAFPEPEPEPDPDLDPIPVMDLTEADCVSFVKVLLAIFGS